MLKIRQSLIGQFIEQCETILELKLLKGLEGIANDRMLAGTAVHAEIENAFDKGEILPSIKPYHDFFVSGYNVESWDYEKQMECRYNNKYTITGSPDWMIYLEDKREMIIADWKSTKLAEDIKEKNIEDTILNLMGYWYQKTVQPYIYSYLNFKKHPKLQRILFFYCFPCLPFDDELRMVQFEILRPESFSFVKIAMNKIDRALSINTFFPTNSQTKCEECIMRSDCYVVDKSLKAIEEVNTETSKENISNLMRNINSPESQTRLGDLLYKMTGEIAKVKILKKKINEPLIKLIEETGGESNQIALKDKVIEIKQPKATEKIIDEEITIEYLMTKKKLPLLDIIQCSNISLSKLKEIKEIQLPDEQIKKTEKEKSIKVIYLKT